jgi:hypothetical protein
MLNILIAEAEEVEFGYDVIGVVGSESEARELAASDMAERERKIENDEEAPLPVYIYKMYQRGTDGYACVLEIPASEVTA